MVAWQRQTIIGSCVAAALAPAIVVAAPLKPIPKGTIAINLDTIATGLAAPDYAITAPGAPDRLFVLEQNGLVRVVENGALLAAPALDIRPLVSPPLVTTNANDERGLLGIAFHPGFNDPSSVGFHTVYTYNSQVIPTDPN